jgi:hypothetical protein
MSEYLFDKLSAVHIKCRIIQYSTHFSAVHRSIQLFQNGRWVDAPYKKYGFHTMFHATTSKPNLTIIQ